MSVAIGHRVVALSCLRPYLGWNQFGQRIRELAETLRRTELLDEPERFSLKYVDVIEGKPNLRALKMAVHVGDRALSDEPIELRTELRGNDVVHIVEIALPATVRLQNGEEVHGSMISADTLCVSTGDVTDLWDNFEPRLEHVHAANKELFFSLLADATLESLGPD